MEQPKITVIIPVYNVENYLHQCLDSIINQTLREIEIICINDQSTDESLSILEQYAKEDRRITVLNQINAGAGAARNKGLKIAKGKYLSFLDSDDFFELDMLEKAYNACVSENADFVVFRCNRFNDISKKFESCEWTIRKELLPVRRPFCYKDISKNIFRLFNGWAWDKLYNHEFVQKNNLVFQEQRTTNDLLFVFSALVKAERITTIEDVLAHQRINNSSSLSNTREKSWNCFYLALMALGTELKAMGIYKEVEQSYINYALNFSLWNLNTIKGATYEKLYNSLRRKYFDELGVSQHDKEYFWSKDEYEQYLRVKNTPLSDGFLNGKDVLHKNKKLKIQAILSNVGRFERCFYKIGRIITSPPSKFQKIIRCLRENGWRYTLRKILTKLF